MSSGKVTNNSRSEIHDWNYRVNRLNDQIAERRFRKHEGFHGAEGSSPQRVNSGSRNLGYNEDEERKVSNKRSFGMSDDMEQRYHRNKESRNAGYRGHFVERSRMYRMPDDEDNNDGHNYYREMDEKGYSKTDFRKDRRDNCHEYKEMNDMGHRETKFGKDTSNDPNYYQEIYETGYRETEFRKERRGNRSKYQGMNDETGYIETEFCDGKASDRNGRDYPQNIRYMDRRLHHPRTTLNYQPPNAQYIDRGSDFPQSNMQCQPDTSAWNTQAPSTVPYPLEGEPIAKGQEEVEEKKPRKRWWYTTSRVFSVLLIFCSVVLDWLQFFEMQDLIINELHHALKDPLGHTFFDTFTSKNCTVKPKRDEANYFWYLTVAGTVLAGLQFANIIYQIIQNHRLPIDTDITNCFEERTEVFLVNMFIKFPQLILIDRFEVNLCLVCDIGPSIKLKGLLNGLSSLASTVWRHLTHFKTCSCSKMCEKCAAGCGNCVKNCLFGCIKSLCPTRFCCIEFKDLFPFCFMHLICKKFWMCITKLCRCRCRSKSPSIIARLAFIPTSFVAFLIGLKIAKFFCWPPLSNIITAVFDDAIGFLWNRMFYNE
ncbi:uncharacterized protein LOC128189980 [Crassostrea angulata]|uniref:uncharacterized protein LOC128189980 n=1 Tax=Magallana angulata TaxID=2784310 RepID=UPI0022B13F96|nr:uncharacterized protein LOC128189980 [Crassostrea angulata]